MNFPRISIVMPSFNQAAFLEAAIQSIISQQYPNLDYIVIDGGSTDGSVDILEKYAHHFSYWVSEKDSGQYEALQKGFEKTTGEIMGWLNSDDLLHRQSLFVLANIFDNNKHINWLQGRPSMYDESGMTVETLEPVYSKFHFYMKRYTGGRFIQQESTYWRRDLWQKAGSRISTDYKYAGDFELWMRFFKHDIMHHATALIGGYRVRPTQASRTFFEHYLDECNRIIDLLPITKEELSTMRNIRFHESALMKQRVLAPFLRKFFKRVLIEQRPVTFNYQLGKFLQDREA